MGLWSLDELPEISHAEDGTRPRERSLQSRNIVKICFDDLYPKFSELTSSC